MAKKEANKTPWFIIWTAVTISILICLIVTSLRNEKFDWYTVAFFLIINICWELIPYAILIVIWKGIETQKNVSKKYGIIGAFVLLILSQIFWDIIFWISAYTPPHDSSFTTGVFVVTSVFVGGIGYGIGWLIALLVKKIKTKKSF